MQTASNVVDFPFATRRPVPAVPSAEGERDRQFVGMLRAFRETGGLARGDEVAELLVQRGAGDVSRLARWIVSGDVLGFDWKGELWVPLFQFELKSMAIRPEAQQVAAELPGDFDTWARAMWFASPNVWLDDRSPADALATDLASVLAAARADRFAVGG